MDREHLLSVQSASEPMKELLRVAASNHAKESDRKRAEGGRFRHGGDDVLAGAMAVLIERCRIERGYV